MIRRRIKPMSAQTNEFTGQPMHPAHRSRSHILQLHILARFPARKVHRIRSLRTTAEEVAGTAMRGHLPVSGLRVG